MPVKHIMDVTKSQSILMTKGNNYLNLFRWFYCFCIICQIRCSVLEKGLDEDQCCGIYRRTDAGTYSHGLIM